MVSFLFSGEKIGKRMLTLVPLLFTYYNHENKTSTAQSPNTRSNYRYPCLLCLSKKQPPFLTTDKLYYPKFLPKQQPTQSSYTRCSHQQT